MYDVFNNFDFSTTSGFSATAGLSPVFCFSALCTAESLFDITTSAQPDGTILKMEYSHLFCAINLCTYNTKGHRTSIDHLVKSKIVYKTSKVCHRETIELFFHAM